MQTLPPPLELQRLVGNRATCQLLSSRPSGETIQRTIATSPERMKGLRSLIEGSVGGKSTYDKLREALVAYHSRPGNTPALPYVDTILDLADYWMDKYANSRDRSIVAKRRIVEVLQLEALRERGVIRAQARYVVDVRQKQMAALSEAAPMYAVRHSNTILGGDIPKKDKTWSAAQRTALSSKLTLAELAAIRIYSMEDYRYINPAVANDRGWMDARNKSSAAKANTAEPAGGDEEVAPRTENIDELITGASEVDGEPPPRTDNIDELVAGGASHHAGGPESDAVLRTEAIENLEESLEQMRTDEAGSLKGNEASEAKPSHTEPIGNLEPDSEQSPYHLNTYMQEGAMHGAILMQALDKLPPWQGTAYRGARFRISRRSRSASPRDSAR